MQRWSVVQQELIPELRCEVGPLTPKLEKVIHILEWVRIEGFVESAWSGVGRPPHDRSALASAFVAKAVLGLTTTEALTERLQMDRALRRICGFSMWKRLPAPSTFSRAFDEFAQAKLAQRVHEALVKAHLGQALIGHISRDGTAIAARERPARKEKTQPAAQAKRGRPRKDEVRAPKLKTIARQLGQSLTEILAALPKACDRGSKCNAQGYKINWNGYKLHLDTADCGVVVSAVLTSASVHDSQTAAPLAQMTQAQVTHCYDLMDAGHCSAEIRNHSRSLGHVSLIDHNPRGGEKISLTRRRNSATRNAARLSARMRASRMNSVADDLGPRPHQGDEPPHVWPPGADGGPIVAPTHVAAQGIGTHARALIPAVPGEVSA